MPVRLRTPISRSAAFRSSAPQEPTIRLSPAARNRPNAPSGSSATRPPKLRSSSGGKLAAATSSSPAPTQKRDARRGTPIPSTRRRPITARTPTTTAEPSPSVPSSRAAALAPTMPARFWTATASKTGSAGEKLANASARSSARPSRPTPTHSCTTRREMTSRAADLDRRLLAAALAMKPALAVHAPSPPGTDTQKVPVPGESAPSPRLPAREPAASVNARQRTASAEHKPRSPKSFP